MAAAVYRRDREEPGRDGVKNLAIVTPGFAADCVETLEEIAIGARESFLEHGGEQVHLRALPER